MSSKNSRVKIHVGRNQKFTSKNSRAKNSHGRQGLFCGPVFPSQKQLQSNEKQTTPTTGKTLARYFLLFYCDMKTKRKKQTNFVYIYKVSKFFAKKVKKNLQSYFFVVPLYQRNKKQ